MKLIYLAGPIDRLGREEMFTLRRRATEVLGSNGFTVYDPAKSVLAGRIVGNDDRPDPRVAEIHREALERSDGMLAILPEGVPTIGTPMEIEQMRQLGRPVAIVGGWDSWHLAGYTGEGLRTFRDEDDALSWLASCFSVAADFSGYADTQEFTEEKLQEAFGPTARFVAKAVGEMTLPEIQEDIDRWAVYNFGEDQPLWHPFVGVAEEAGELLHVLLKVDQGIRGEDLELKGKDAIGDGAVYSMAVCAKMGWDYESIVREVWADVRTRDWKRFPKNGRTE